MSTITRSIALDISNAAYVREKAACFKEAAETETRPDVAARLFSRLHSWKMKLHTWKLGLNAGLINMQNPIRLASVIS